MREWKARLFSEQEAQKVKRERIILLKAKLILLRDAQDVSDFAASFGE